jgi:hypothetical protein
MASGVAHRSPNATSSQQPTSPPLTQAPFSTFQPLPISQIYEPVTHRQPSNYVFIYDSPVAAHSFNAEFSAQQVSPVSGTQASVGTPVASVGSNGKRKGPPEVQWDASTDRKYARLYSLSDADIDDLPIILRDKRLKFE